MKTTKFLMVPMAALISLSIASCSSSKKEDPAPVVPEKPVVPEVPVVPPKPTFSITGFSPEKVIPNTAISIKGSNFNKDVNKLRVTFNGVEGTVYSASATEMIVGVPANAVTGKIIVIADGAAVTSVTDLKVLKGTQTTFATGHFARIAIDGGGNVYGDGTMYDPYRSVVYKATPAGVVSVFAEFEPNAINLWGTATDAAGNVYVTEHINTRIRKISPAGVVTTLAGGEAGFADGVGAAAKFTAPFGLVIDGAGNLFTVDAGRVRKITPAGVVSTIAGDGTRGVLDGTGANARIGSTNAIAIDATGNLYINDSRLIRKITPEGVVKTIAGSGNAGFANGIAGDAEFYWPEGMAVDANGNVFVADNKKESDSVIFTIRMVNKAGHVTTFLKNTYPSNYASPSTMVNGVLGVASTNYPNGIAFDAAGDMYICNTGAGVVSKITFN